jgi:hypothetical protein
MFYWMVQYIRLLTVSKVTCLYCGNVYEIPNWSDTFLTLSGGHKISVPTVHTSLLSRFLKPYALKQTSHANAV